MRENISLQAGQENLYTQKEGCRQNRQKRMFLSQQAEKEESWPWTETQNVGCAQKEKTSSA